MTWKDSRYEIFLGDAQEAKKLHYQLRYRVFCAEKGWEDGKGASSEMEFDAYDDFSAHMLARDRFTGEWVGGLRMIMLPAGYLPISKLCDIERGDKAVRCAEVSRLFIVPGCRDGGRSSGEVVLRLIWAAREYMMAQGLEGWYVLIQPSFERKLRRLGLGFADCGEGVEFKGWRKPYYGDFDESFRVISDHMQTIAGVSARSYLLYSKVFGRESGARMKWRSLIPDKGVPGVGLASATAV